MNDRRSCYHYHNSQEHHDVQEILEEKRRMLENELKQKTYTIDKLRNGRLHCNQQNDLLSAACISPEKSIARSGSQRSTSSFTNKLLIKDRELTKLKTLLFEKDNEMITLTSANKNALAQMEERIERERKVWNEHTEFLLAGERKKFEEEKARSFKDLQDQLKLEQERCQRLEQKLQESQRVSNEAQLLLKDSGRERINAVYGIKEQCRKEFQDEVTRLRNQFQLEKDAECARVQDRVRELEDALDRATNENADAALRQHELFMNLETSEKASVRTISDCIKKLLIAIDSSSNVFSKIPHITSFKYDQKSIMERQPTQSVLKLLQDTVNDTENYITELKVQTDAKEKSSNKIKLLTERSTDYLNRKFDDDIKNTRKRYHTPIKNSFLKDQKENDYFLPDIDRLPDSYSNDYHRLQNNSCNPFPLSTEQNDTINNLVQKLEDHIATELNRLTRQRLIINGSNYHDDPPKIIKFEPDTKHTNPFGKQDTLIRHLQGRISDLQDDNLRLRDHQQSKIYSTIDSKLTTQGNDNLHLLSSMRLHTAQPI